MASSSCSNQKQNHEIGPSVHPAGPSFQPLFRIKPNDYAVFQFPSVTMHVPDAAGDILFLVGDVPGGAGDVHGQTGDVHGGGGDVPGGAGDVHGATGERVFTSAETDCAATDFSMTAQGDFVG